MVQSCNCNNAAYVKFSDVLEVCYNFCLSGVSFFAEHKLKNILEHSIQWWKSARQSICTVNTEQGKILKCVLCWCHQHGGEGGRAVLPALVTD